MELRIYRNSKWCLSAVLVLSLGLAAPTVGSAAKDIESEDRGPDQHPGVTKCFGVQQHYRFLANQWSAKGDDPWKPSSFNLANAFDLALRSDLESQIDSAVISFDENSDELRILFYSELGALVWERRQSVQVQSCGPDQSNLMIKGVLAGDGARESYIKDVRLSRLSDGIRIETEVRLNSSFLFFGTERKRNYMAEFRQK